MYNLRSNMVLLRKLQSIVILSSPFNTNLSKIHIATRFIKRNFTELVQMKTRAQKDEEDNKKLQQLLQDSCMNKKYKLLQYELEYMREMSEPIPKVFRPKDYIYLLNSSKTHQRKYLRFLFINEIKKEKTVQKRQKLKEKAHLEMMKREEICPSGLKYGLMNNSLFIRIYDQSLDNFLNYSLAISSMFEPNIVFDCGYDDVMLTNETLNCAKQILYSFVLNRMHNHPAKLYLCNASRHNQVIQMLHNLIPNLYDGSFPLEITSESYLDMFDRNKLVYLTPHCRTEMTFYNPDKIYIIGGVVDKRCPQPYSLAKAKKEGIYMEKLPLDKYLYWNTGSNKCLTLNQVLGILLDVKYTKNWITAFTNYVPTRKMKIRHEYFEDSITVKNY